MDDYSSFNIEINGIRVATDTGVSPRSMPKADVLFLSPRYERGELLTNCPAVIVLYHWYNMHRPSSRPLNAMTRPAKLSIPLAGNEHRGFQQRRCGY